MQTLEIGWYFLNETFIVIHLPDCHGKDSSRRFYVDFEFERTKFRMYVCSSKTRIFLSVYVDDINMGGKKQNMGFLRKKMMKDADLEEPTSFLHQVNVTSGRPIDGLGRY